MSKIRVTNILLNPAPEPFASKITVQIYVDLLAQIANDMEIRAIYIGSAESSEFDQILSQAFIPIKDLGQSYFELSMDAPDIEQIPTLEDLLGPSVLMVCALYNNQEFFRCSYFVYNNDIRKDAIELNEENFDVNSIYRCFLTDKPRIKLSDIDWEDWDYNNLVKVNNEEHIDSLKKANEQMLMDFGNPFQLNENSIFNR